MSRDDLQHSLAASARKHRGPHPLPDKLLAYHLGELDNDQEDQIQKHVALCSECALQILDMAEFLDPNPAEAEDDPRIEKLLLSARQEAFGDSEMEPENSAGFKRSDPSRAGRTKPTQAKSRRRIPTSAQLGWAAAIFFAALSGIFGSKPGQRTQDSGARSFANPTLIELGTAETRGEGGVDPIHLPLRTEATVLIFPLPEDLVFPRFEATFKNLEGNTVRRRSDLVRSEEGLITLGVFRDFLAPGRYEATITGLEEGEQPRILESFPFDWQLEEESP